MAMVRDLTPKFREAVRTAAVANGYDEVIEQASQCIMLSGFPLPILRIAPLT